MNRDFALLDEGFGSVQGLANCFKANTFDENKETQLTADPFEVVRRMNQENSFQKPFTNDPAQETREFVPRNRDLFLKA